MKQFTNINDVKQLSRLLADAIEMKKNTLAYYDLGKKKTLGLLFMNPSLRTRLSTQKAALNLGMNVIVMNINNDGWALEFGEGAIMNGGKAEHIKDAAAVIGTYCDIIGLRCFPSLVNKEEDYSEYILKQFIKYTNKPIVSLESATVHPLQSLADLITITENQKSNKKPKVVLNWAPHIKSLPQAVPNSFAEWMLKADVDFVITHPPGYELAEEFTAGAAITHNQNEALKDADFIYVKNWSSYTHYGMMPDVKETWLLDEEKMKLTNNAYIMHCLPVRRNVELKDELIDSKQSLVLQQAENRVYAAQIVLRNILDELK
ncbi:MAG: N-acetylornithine carbamoyltransferase [Bacteroidetes bacterium]|nr:N-acetylornithine carbamoyltransferase [Bacteroidota bacterium]